MLRFGVLTSSLLQENGAKDHIERLILQALEQRPDNFSKSLEYLSVVQKEKRQIHTIPVSDEPVATI